MLLEKGIKVNLKKIIFFFESKNYKFKRFKKISLMYYIKMFKCLNYL